MSLNALCWAAALLMVGTHFNVDASRIDIRLAQPSLATAATPSSTSEAVQQDQARLAVNQKHCHGLDCPKYDVLNTVGDIQLRRYEASTWVRTNVTGAESFEAATITGAAELSRYFLGNNAAKQLVRPTIPIVTVVYSDMSQKVEASETLQLNFGELFGVAAYLPQEYKSAPPQPLGGKHMDTTKLPEGLKLWVHTFPGSASAAVIREEVRYMLKALRSANLDGDIVDSKFYVAQYDPLGSTSERHNEVWVMA